MFFRSRVSRSVLCEGEDYLVKLAASDDKVAFEYVDGEGVFSLSFLAFSTIVTVQGYFHESTATDTSIGSHTFPSQTHYKSVASNAELHATELRLKAKEAAEGIIAQCRELERILSRTRADSEISRINRASKEAIEVSSLTWHALAQGLSYSAKSEGLFDVTMGIVTQLWDFSKGIKPSEADVAEAVRHVDYRAVTLHASEKGGEERYFVQKTDSKTSIDLGGTAKGFIADRLCEYLKTEGVGGAFVNLGGNVAVFGSKRNGDAWRIGVKDPFDKNSLCGRLVLHEGSVVTSGLYERCFSHEGHLYHHILDCKTGYPVETDIAGVTVLASTSADADGYSTTLFSRGSSRAIDFLNKTPGLEGLIVTKEGVLITSRGLCNFERE